MSELHCDIAIIGAGIGGLTAAIALAQSGREPHVFEQARLLSAVGAGIQLAPNASRELHRLGLGPGLQQVGTRPSAVRMRRWDDGELLAETALGPACEDRYGAAYYALHRADLHKLLIESVPSGTVHLGFQCTEIIEHADSVTVVFDNGCTLETELLIGADGIHSKVRDHLQRDEPVFSGQVIYRGLVPAERLSFLTVEPCIRLWLGADRHFVCYPISGGRTINFGATVPGAGNGGLIESWSATGELADLRAGYDGWHEDVGRVLDEATTVGVWALHDREELETWSTDRVTVIGDAAHPMLPFIAQGANLAIEDGVALAELLARAPSPERALRDYERLRRPRAAEVQSSSRRSSAQLHADEGPRTSDEELADLHRLEQRDWLFGYDAREAAR